MLNKKGKGASANTYPAGFMRGFTLIELVVVLGLFMLIMGVTVSLFISIVRQQKRILSSQEMLNQVSYVEDYFSRSLRNTVVSTTGNCPLQLTHANIETGFYQGIQFLSKEGICQEFFLDADGALKEKTDDSVAQNILSVKYKVLYAKFVMAGTLPRITMVMGVQDPAYSDIPPMIIQTTVSKR